MGHMALFPDSSTGFDKAVTSVCTFCRFAISLVPMESISLDRDRSGLFDVTLSRADDTGWSMAGVDTCCGDGERLVFETRFFDSGTARITGDEVSFLLRSSTSSHASTAATLTFYVHHAKTSFHLPLSLTLLCYV